MDDVVYFDEPMFSDSPLSDAIDDVAAARSALLRRAAGNEGEQRSWDSRVTWSSPERPPEGTDLDFARSTPRSTTAACRT